MNIIVTGASRGIGYELVKLFARQKGNTVFAIARTSEKLEKLKNECNGSGISNVIPLVCDLANEKEAGLLPSRIEVHVRYVDVLVNNAGAIINRPFEKITTEELQSVYNVNVFVPFRLIQKLLPLMNPDQRCHIINISSMGGFQGSSKFAGLSAYSSSKAALACLTECLAEEYKDKNIAFNCLALGAAQTEMLNEAFPGYQAPLSAAQMAAFIADFSLSAHEVMNGKIIPLSMSTP